MAIGFAHLTSAYDGTDRVTYTTASVSPTASRWLVVDFAQRKGSPPDDPSISGLSLSYTKELTLLDGTGTVVTRLTRWYAWTGSSPGSGTIAMNCTATQTAGAWIVYELSGTDTSDPFVQTAGNNPAGNATSNTTTLSAFADSSNRPLITHLHRANEGSTVDSTPSAYTQIDANNVFGNAPALSASSAINTSNTDTTPSFSWTTSCPSITIASEIAILPTSTKRPIHRYSNREAQHRASRW